MRKTIYTFLLFCSFLPGKQAMMQNTVLVGWTFPVNSLVADTGLNLILDNEISTMGGTSPISIVTGYTTNAARATGWDLGMGTKAWLIKTKSTGYHNLTVSSRQFSGSEYPGPKFFQIQYSIDFGFTWNDVDGGEVTVESDWETGFVNNLALPAICNDRESLWIRWVMSLNVASGGGGVVQENGRSIIDEIFIKGDNLNNVVNLSLTRLTLFPNPAGESVTIVTNHKITETLLYDLTGRLVAEELSLNEYFQFDVTFLEEGMYILIVYLENGLSPSLKLMIKR